MLKNIYIFLLTKERSILNSILSKSNPNTDLNGLMGLQDVEAAAPRFSKNRHMKVARLSALRPRRLYRQEITLMLISVRSCVEFRAIMLPEKLSQ